MKKLDKRKKRRLKLLITDAALLLAAVAMLIVCRSLAGTLQSQRAAERWTGESEQRFEQMSCFMSSDDDLTLNDIYTFRQALDKKLVEASLEAADGGALYHDAWSSTGTVKVYGDNGNGDAGVIAVGGDYFFFHPLKLLSGSYISENDLMKDRVVLDKELAWRLFGGTQLEGLTVTINGTQYVVAGVIDREADRASKKAYNGGAGLYMSFEAFSSLSDSENGTAIDCYEIVMPQPVDGFAEDVLKTTFKIGGGEIVNNSSRFENGKLWGIVRSFGTRSMHLNSVIYPYWENAARYLEDWCALLFFAAVLLIILPAASALVTLMILLIRGKDYLEDNVPEWTANAIDRGREKRYVRRYGGAHSAPKPEKKTKRRVFSRGGRKKPKTEAEAAPSEAWEQISRAVEQESDDSTDVKL